MRPQPTTAPAEPAGPVTGPRVLVIVAHPDDETFGCGSLLAHLVSCGARTAVTCLTRGEAGELAPGVDAPEGIAALRDAELRAAARVLGVHDVEVLDFRDSGTDGEPGPHTVCGVPDDDLDAAVRGALRRRRPDVVVTLDGSDGHRDHLRLRAAVERVVAGTGTGLYLHSLPRSLMHEWIRFHQGDDQAAVYTRLPEIGAPDEQLTTVLDTSPHRAVRDRAIAVHRSQRSPFAGLPDELRRAFLERDHLIRVNPPWTGGPVETRLAGIRPPTRGDGNADHAGHRHTMRCWWHPTGARWVCPAAGTAAVG